MTSTSTSRPSEPDGAIVLARARLPGADAPVDVLIDGGVIDAVGDLPASERPACERVDVDGCTLLPGLWDAHVHAEQWAVARRRLDLRGARDAREAADVVASAAARTASDEPLIGVGFRGALWADPPHKDLLQAVAPGRVVALQSHDLHTAWLSPAALAQVGAPEHPTGVLQEVDCYRAMQALQEHDAATVDRWVREALHAAAALGVVGIGDFEFGDAVPSWQRRAAGGPLATRVSATVYREHLGAAIARGWPSGTPVPGTAGLVTVGPLKLFVDGSLNSRTALCHDPYPGEAALGTAHGRLETPPDELRALLAEAAAHGIGGAVHAIGDRANTLALDAFEAVGVPGRIEHAQLLVPDDVARFAALGVVASVQPGHLPDDRDVADRLWAGRGHRSFPLRDLLDAGVRVEFGSDAPVAPLDPWRAIVAAVTRTGDDRPAWHPEQRITVADALAASTRGRTRVAVGDPADLVLVDRDPYRSEPGDLAAPEVAATLCAGRFTHRTV